jgi:predicted Zn-dependent protease
MAKTPRMEQLEALLTDDPADPFLRYGLALEYAGQGDDETAVRKLRELIADTPYVPAYLMAGQALLRLGREGEAAAILRQGIEAARTAGDFHALSEMQGLLATAE